MQEQDGKRRGDMLHQDQLMAIEAQDRELAKVLQEQVRKSLVVCVCVPQVVIFTFLFFGMGHTWTTLG